LPIPFWFGRDDRPLFGWFHEPEDGQAIGGAVLCPPIGHEGINAHFAFRKLAEQLCDNGFAVLRFDYDGTGDSAGDMSDPGRVEAWSASVRAAVELVRDTGVPHVALIGLRLGATLAAQHVVNYRDVDSLLLWDPCVSGSSFIREQHALFRFASEVKLDGEGGVETPGYFFRFGDVSDLGRLRIEPVVTERVASLGVLCRRDRSPDTELEIALGEPTEDWAFVDGQTELLGLAEVPRNSLDHIVAWMKRQAGQETVEINVPRLSSEAVVGHDAAGRSITERAIFLQPLGLFAILTEIEEVSGSAQPHGMKSPFILFFNVGIYYRIGPGRLWVDLARQWAGAGQRSLRVDRSGIGDSPVRPGQAEQVTYAKESLFDVRDIAIAISPDDPSNVALIGLCAGADLAVRGGLMVRARAVCVINIPPVIAFSPGATAEVARSPGRRRRNSLRMWMRSGRTRTELLRKFKRRIPWRVWWVFDVLHIVRSPASGFRSLVENGTQTLVLCDTRDAEPFMERAPWVIRKLRTTGLFQFEIFEASDHLLLSKRSRTFNADRLTQFILGIFGETYQ
jgi:pimeloyl-ACP methyl ester carboxylesterase